MLININIPTKLGMYSDIVQHDLWIYVVICLNHPCLKHLANGFDAACILIRNGHMAKQEQRGATHEIAATLLYQ